NLNDVVWVRSGGESKRTVVRFFAFFIIIRGRKINAGATLEGGEEGGYHGGANPARGLIKLFQGSRAQIRGGGCGGIDAAAVLHGLAFLAIRFVNLKRSKRFVFLGDFESYEKTNLGIFLLPTMRDDVEIYVFCY
ncbi:hypothetical protein CARUB_v10003383mg, partial [Capsella rubella]